MRTSIAALALITRCRGGETEYLAHWNRDWNAWHFVGGHKQEDETFRECMTRELTEELGIMPSGFSIAGDPTGRLHYITMSRRASVDTAYTMELFDVELHDDVLVEVERRPENAWLSLGEIEAGAAHDGRAVSPTLPLILGKTGRLPVVRNAQVFAIGVTGHRDFCTYDRHEIVRKMNAVFTAGEREAGGRTIEALSPLAVGADQLFARLALIRGYRLIAPLPLPLELYRRDFCRERGGEFERLLLSAAEWYSLPFGGWPSQPGREDVAVPGLARDGRYEAVGRHVVKRSDLLVALWDGQRNGKQGGTGEIVAFARCAAEAGQPLRIEIVPVRRENQG